MLRVMAPLVTKLQVITSSSPTVAEYSAEVIKPTKVIFLVPVVSRNNSNDAMPASVAVLAASMKTLVSSELLAVYSTSTVPEPAIKPPTFAL